jgi:uncharacterized membrane protein
MTSPTPSSRGDAPLSTRKRPAKTAATVGDEKSLEHFEMVGRTVAINRPREELYAFWHTFSNLAAFMENIEQITVIDATRSHWVVKAPAGRQVEWDSIIDEDIPNERISWRSAPGSDIQHAGRVEFRDAPGGRGTAVTATFIYDPPAGKLGTLFARIFQREPKIQARRDLRRFKQLMETGEIATSQPPEAAPRG